MIGAYDLYYRGARQRYERLSKPQNMSSEKQDLPSYSASVTPNIQYIGPTSPYTQQPFSEPEKKGSKLVMAMAASILLVRLVVYGVPGIMQTTYSSASTFPP